MYVDGLHFYVLLIPDSEHLNRLLLLIVFLFLFRWSFPGEAADLRRRQQLRLHQWELYRCMYLETVNKPTCSDTYHMVCVPQDWWTHVGPVPEALTSTLPHTPQNFTVRAWPLIFSNQPLCWQLLCNIQCLFCHPMSMWTQKMLFPFFVNNLDCLTR